MNSIFFRIYGGLLAALVLTAALGAAGFHITKKFVLSIRGGWPVALSFDVESLETLDTVERKRSIALWSVWVCRAYPSFIPGVRRARSQSCPARKVLVQQVKVRRQKFIA